MRRRYRGFALALASSMMTVMLVSPALAQSTDEEAAPTEQYEPCVSEQDCDTSTNDAPPPAFWTYPARSRHQRSMVPRSWKNTSRARKTKAPARLWPSPARLRLPKSVAPQF